MHTTKSDAASRGNRNANTREANWISKRGATVATQSGVVVVYDDMVWDKSFNTSEREPCVCAATFHENVVCCMGKTHTKQKCVLDV